MDFFVSNINN